MVKASTGSRRRGRRRLKSEIRRKFTTESRMNTFKPNDKIIIKIDPSSTKGIPHLKFAGATGVIKSVRGGAYMVEVKKGNKSKKLLARPEHMRRI